MVAVSSKLIGRDVEVHLALLALVCREHLLLLGPPGTAKSLLVESLVNTALEHVKEKSENQKRAKPPSAASSVQHRATCALCRADIVGSRFKSMTLKDYDECSSCRTTKSEKPDDDFYEITDASETTVPEDVLATYRANKIGYFRILLTQFSEPNELYGPVDVSKLVPKDGSSSIFERQVNGYLPKARVGFVDEVFKANSAILNSMLTLMNERQYRQGANMELASLVSLFGASNEFPSDASLDALYDRFLFRYWTAYLEKDGFRQLLGCVSKAQKSKSGASESNDPRKLDNAWLQKSGGLRDLALRHVTVRTWVLDFLEDLRVRLRVREKQIRVITDRDVVSDRRWCQILSMLIVSAYTNGRDEIAKADCWLVAFTLWKRSDIKAMSASVDEKDSYLSLIIKDVNDALNSIKKEEIVIGNGENIWLAHARVCPNAACKNEIQFMTSSCGKCNAKLQ